MRVKAWTRFLRFLPEMAQTSQDRTEPACFQYVGSELELFRQARNWKAYWSSHVRPYLRGDVLEVGAGLGANTELLAGEPFDSWTALEPDAELTQGLALPSPRHRLVNATLAEIPGLFDAILYIDVLEHIEHDREELARAATHLKPGGALIVLSPAHQWLFSPFDAAIGHYRRYSRASLRAAAPPELRPVRIAYLDTVGLLASAANRLLLSQSMPTEKQILTWDRLMVPVSRAVFDPLTGGRIGKSVLGIWSLPQ